MGAQSPEASLRLLVLSDKSAPVSGAQVTAADVDRGIEYPQRTHTDGTCVFQSLPPGLYDIRVSLDGYSPVVRQSIRLDVSSRREMTVTLTDASSAPTRARADIDKMVGALPSPPILPVETVASSVSVVVSENKILELPLLNRNLYSLFLLQPGVTSQGASVRRGLSFTVHGQRVSGSNYLLDGVDNNNIRLTGPVTLTSLEGIQSVRMINSSFSADAGRATAFVAHVSTRPGTNALHGGAFAYLGHDSLDANTFQNNASGHPKTPIRHLQAGFSVGGPIVRNRTFFFSVLERSRLRFANRQTQHLPTAAFIESLPQGLLRDWFQSTPPLPVTPNAADPTYGSVSLDVPNELDTLLSTQRVDHTVSGGRDRLTVRYAFAGTDLRSSDQASQEFRGYDALWPTDQFNAHNSTFGWTRTFASGPVNELRAGWNRSRAGMPRPFPERPIVLVRLPVLIAMPTNIRPIDERANNNVLQIADIFNIRKGRSSVTFGVEMRRNFSNGISPGLDSDALLGGGGSLFTSGFFPFLNLASVRNNAPGGYAAAVDRFASPLRAADLYRRYRSADYAAFVQNDMKLTRRLSLNLGLRWESFGVIHDTDPSRDINFYFGPGNTAEERLKNGVLRRTTDNPGDLYGLVHRPDKLNFAPSVGIAWDPFGRASTVFRAGYALAYDRIYDAARDVRTNSAKPTSCPPNICGSVLPLEDMLQLIPLPLPPTSAVIIDENLKTPYAQNWYAGIQHQVTSTLLVEVGHAGSVGRKLASRDIVNRREFGTSAAQTRDDNFITNQGNSNYLGLEIGVRQRVARGLNYQLSYTWSHAIDNQSDLLEGVRVGPDRLSVAVATFTRQLDPVLDRGNANFDQRHNLVFNFTWDLPAPRSGASRLFGGWTLSGIGAYRTGFPVSVISTTAVAPGLRNNRLDLAGDPESRVRPDVPGGKQWLVREDFALSPQRPGTLSRNALSGPGFWNYDLAVMRTIPLRDTRIRLQFRAEFYNAFNHANLLPPVSDFSQADFGVSYAGRSRTFSRFGELPLDTAARRIQFALRVQF